MLDAGIIDPIEEEPDSIFHQGNYRVKLCDVKVWTPTPGSKLDIEPIEQTIINLDQTYHLTALGYDPWQSEYLSERLKKAGIPVQPVQFVPHNLQSMAQAVLETVNETLIDLYDHPQLLSDLRALRVAERGYGIRLESPRGPSGHGDAATGLSIALHLARAKLPFTYRNSSARFVAY